MPRLTPPPPPPPNPGFGAHRALERQQPQPQPELQPEPQPQPEPRPRTKTKRVEKPRIKMQLDAKMEEWLRQEARRQDSSIAQVVRTLISDARRKEPRPRMIGK